ncbi:hypothetical protein HPB52_019318 [Rhipicephalus sanguineus]|uniref:HTH CENPB-type domain-containing protein n=1 Tax=Rhipicephalus sanguineus TaxID=34632 RepID=A0A9D4T492_RHISA|nr:hypothetical protein HPB52_019318 [Rhipicephalus sanguineus]
MPSMHSYTVAKKIEVVQWHRQAGRNAHTTSRHFNIDRRRIREWDNKYVALLQQNFGKSKSRRKLSNGATVLSEEVDDALFEFFQSERSAGRAVSNRLLAEEAVRIARSLQLRNFVASDHYIARWKKCFGISMRQATNESQKTPDDYAEAARAFRLSDVLNFVAAAWDAVPEETTIQRFKGCGISNVLDGSEDGLLHGQLSDVGDIRPEHPEELQAEWYSLLFDTDSDGSFDGFESE